MDRRKSITVFFKTESHELKAISYVLRRQLGILLCHERLTNRVRKSERIGFIKFLSKHSTKSDHRFSQFRNLYFEIGLSVNYFAKLFLRLKKVGFSCLKCIAVRGVNWRCLCHV